MGIPLFTQKVVGIGFEFHYSSKSNFITHEESNGSWMRISLLIKNVVV